VTLGTVYLQLLKVLTGRNTMSRMAISSIFGPFGVVLKAYSFYTASSKIALIGPHRHCSYDIPKKIE